MQMRNFFRFLVIRNLLFIKNVYIIVNITYLASTAQSSIESTSFDDLVFCLSVWNYMKIGMHVFFSHKRFRLPIWNDLAKVRSIFYERLVMRWRKCVSNIVWVYFYSWSVISGLSCQNTLLTRFCFLPVRFVRRVSARAAEVPEDGGASVRRDERWSRPRASQIRAHPAAAEGGARLRLRQHFSH